MIYVVVLAALIANPGPEDSPAPTKHAATKPQVAICDATYEGRTSSCSGEAARGLYSDSCVAVFLDVRLAVYREMSPHVSSTLHTFIHSWSRDGHRCPCEGGWLATRAHGAGPLRSVAAAEIFAKRIPVRPVNMETGEPEPATFVFLEDFRATVKGSDSWRVHRPLVSAPALPAFSDQALCYEVKQAFSANMSAVPQLPPGWEEAVTLP